MKLSVLISALQRIQARVGDVEVFTYNMDAGYTPPAVTLLVSTQTHHAAHMAGLDEQIKDLPYPCVELF